MNTKAKFANSHITESRRKSMLLSSSWKAMMTATTNTKAKAKHFRRPVGRKALSSEWSYYTRARTHAHLPLALTILTLFSASPIST